MTPREYIYQWRLEVDNPNSTIIDSSSISPQECYTLDILHGVGRA